MVIVSNPEQYEQQDIPEKSVKHKTKAGNCKIIFPPYLKLSSNGGSKQAEEEASKYCNYTEAREIFVRLVMEARYADQDGNF